MQIGIFAKTFAAAGALAAARRGARRRLRRRAVQHGLLGGPSMPDAITPATCDEIAAASRASGVAIAAVSGTYNMIHPDAGVRAEGFARLATLIRAAPRMGTRLVTLCTGTRHATDQWAHHPDNAGLEAWRDLLVEMARAACACRGMRRRSRHRAGTGQRRVVGRTGAAADRRAWIAAYQDRARPGQSVRDGVCRRDRAASSPKRSTCSPTAS